MDRVTRAAGIVPYSQMADKDADPTKRKTKSSEYAILGEALAWPLYLSDRSCLAPLAGSVATAFFAVPYFLPEVSRGFALMIGYGMGSGMYFVEFYGDQPIHEKKGNPDKNV